MTPYCYTSLILDSVEKRTYMEQKAVSCMIGFEKIYIQSLRIKEMTISHASYKITEHESHTIKHEDTRSER